MKDLVMIACVSQDLGIGNQGELLWQIPEDMKFFRETTLGHPVVMGGNTYRSIGQPLAGRENVVLSRSQPDGEVTWFDDQQKMEEYLQKIDDTVFVCGGAMLYNSFLEQADRLILTEVAAKKPADTFFPDFPREKYQREVSKTGEYDGIKYQIVEYRRRRNDEK